MKDLDKRRQSRWMLKPGVIPTPKLSMCDKIMDLASATVDCSDRLKDGAVKTAYEAKRRIGTVGTSAACNLNEVSSVLCAQTSKVVAASTQRFSEMHDVAESVWTAKLDDLKKRLSVHGATTRARTETLSEWFNVLIADRSFALGLDGWIRDAFASGRASIYDRAMDWTYIQSHIGGGYHRLFDGGHDLAGAWKACRVAGGDSLSDDLSGYLHALWKDLATPMGLPLATLDKSSFESLATSLHDQFGINRIWLADAASVTASELVGDVAGILAVALNWSTEDRSKFAGLIGSFGVSSLAGANPLLAVVAAVCLARTYQQTKVSGDWIAALSPMIKGGLGSGTVLAAMSVLTGPAWVGLMVGICCSIVARRAYEHAEKTAREANWSETTDFMITLMRRSLLSNRLGVQ